MAFNNLIIQWGSYTKSSEINTHNLSVSFTNTNYILTMTLSTANYGGSGNPTIDPDTVSTFKTRCGSGERKTFYYMAIGF